MKNILCKIFGHKPPCYAKSGWYTPGQQYGRIRGRRVDGIGRIHVEIHGHCARCDEEFMVARIHLPER